MATVTGLTATRMEAIEDASVVSGAIDGSGHLILTTFGGDDIDAGSALPALPTASATVAGIVELATSAETITGTDTVRATTPAGVKAAIDVVVAAIAALNLNDLADVTITSVAADNVLQYSGSAWVNRADLALASGKQVNVGGSGSTATVAIKAAATTTDIVSSRVTTDAADRLTVDADGKLQWGDGTAAVDTNLYRNGASSLVTDDLFTAVLGVYAFAVINSVASLTVQAFGDAEASFKASSTGILLGAGGSTAPDVNLYRNAANELKTDDSFVVAGTAFTPPHGYIRDPSNDILYNTAGGTFSKATYPGLRGVLVHCYGPGGAGGGSTGAGTNGTNHGCGAGGGSGGYSRAWIPVASLATGETITVGTGGTGVSAGTGNAGSVATSFGTFCIANVGNGGGNSGLVATAQAAIPGAGASVGTGDSPASAGRPGAPGTGNAGLGAGGNGGNAPGPIGGAGAVGRVSGSANASLGGNAGALPGGGGGGSLSNGSGASQTGGAGADGRCIVELYY